MIISASVSKIFKPPTPKNKRLVSKVFSGSQLLGVLASEALPRPSKRPRRGRATFGRRVLLRSQLLGRVGD